MNRLGLGRSTKLFIFFHRKRNYLTIVIISLYFQHRDTKEDNLDIKFEFNDDNKKVIITIVL